jgi:hypothetical protein
MLGGESAISMKHAEQLLRDNRRRGSMRT